jgi:hypothetical protein
MFQHILLFDDRFAVVAQLAGDLSPLQLRTNGGAMATLTEWASDATEATVQSSSAIVMTANVMVWWTLAVEGLIAAAFLLPRSSKLALIGDAALLIFIATTYPVAPVLGFGAVLLTMGLSQAPGAWTRLAYLGGFVLLHAFRVPWAQFVVGAA